MYLTFTADLSENLSLCENFNHFFRRKTDNIDSQSKPYMYVDCLSKVHTCVLLSRPYASFLVIVFLASIGEHAYNNPYIPIHGNK